MVKLKEKNSTNISINITQYYSCSLLQPGISPLAGFSLISKKTHMYHPLRDFLRGTFFTNFVLE